MHKRGLCCRPVSVRWLVRPSVTLVYCIDTAEHIVKFLSRPGSPIIVVFYLSADTQFQGKPRQRGAKYAGVGKFCGFQPISGLLRIAAKD